MKPFPLLSFNSSDFLPRFRGLSEPALYLLHLILNEQTFISSGASFPVFCRLLAFPGFLFFSWYTWYIMRCIFLIVRWDLLCCLLTFSPEFVLFPSLPNLPRLLLSLNFHWTEVNAKLNSSLIISCSKVLSSWKGSKIDEDIAHIFYFFWISLQCLVECWAYSHYSIALEMPD